MLYCLEEIVDIYRHLLYFASKEDLSCHVNHHQTSHLSSPMISLSNNHSSGNTVSLVGVHNLDNLFWSGATFKFLPSPLNQAAPVQSPYSCPPVWIGIHMSHLQIPSVAAFGQKQPLFSPLPLRITWHTMDQSLVVRRTSNVCY
jgi:hypothetical protein